MIVYSVSENQENETATLKSKDESFIKGLMDVLEITVVPTNIIRLGSPGPGKHRPIKLTMSCTDDKESILANLRKLKNADNVYHSLSIRDDYTLKERELVNKYVKEAKQKNDAENTTEWKVRGTPKNGLRVVRITRR